MAVFLPNGIGESLGDSLVTNEPLYMSGDVWYVDSESGSDAGGSAGQDRAAPLATLSQAVTNAADDDIVVLMSTHTEDIASTVTLSKRLTIVGAGQSEGKPTATLRLDDASASLLDVQSDQVQLRNIYFGPTQKAATGHQVEVGDNSSGHSDVVIRGCYFELGGNDDAAAVYVHSTNSDVTLRSCTFKNESGSAQAAQALYVETGATHVVLEGVVFDGGSQGFSDYYAAEIDATSLYAEEVSCLRGADLKLTNSNGYAHVGTATGGSRVDW